MVMIKQSSKFHYRSLFIEGLAPSTIKLMPVVNDAT